MAHERTLLELDEQAKLMNTLFEQYLSTHVLPEEGMPTLHQFRVNAKYFTKLWTKILPADPNSKILDAGCGAGSLLWWLQSREFRNTEGVELCGDLVDIANQLGVNGVVTGDIREHLRTHANSYDVIVLRDVIEHFPKDDVLSLLELCLKSLRDAGRIIVQVPNAESPFFGRTMYGDFTHEVAFTARSLRQVLGACGFRDFAFFPHGPVLVDFKPKSLVAYAMRKLYFTLIRMMVFLDTIKMNAVLTDSIVAVAYK